MSDRYFSMLAPEISTLFFRPLDDADISYMGTGGVAAIVYGEPRLTNDVDVVLALRPEDADRLASAFTSGEYCVPPAEVIAEEAARSRWGHFKLLHLESALRADVYLLGDDPLGTWGMQHRRSVELADNAIWLAPMEYVTDGIGASGNSDSSTPLYGRSGTRRPTAIRFHT